MVDLRRNLFKRGDSDNAAHSNASVSERSGSQFHHVHETNAAAINDDEAKNVGGAAVEDESRTSDHYSLSMNFC